MSEYWKSTPKYWCKHCSTYVKDTPFERKQHENTGKHQGNLKRSLRTIQNDHERGERDKQKAKAEVERLNRVVGTGSPSTIGVAATPVTFTKSATAQQNPADQKRQWAQLAQMGIQVPEEVRSDMAIPGDWKITARRTIEEPTADESLNVGVRKRKYEGQEEEEEAGETIARKGWGSTTKKYPGRDDTNLDLLFSANVPLKRENVVEEPNIDVYSSGTNKDPIKIKTEIPNRGIGSEHAVDSHDLPYLGELLETEVSIPSLVGAEVDQDEKLANTRKPNPEMPPLPVFKKRKGKATPR